MRKNIITVTTFFGKVNKKDGVRREDIERLTIVYQLRGRRGQRAEVSMQKSGESQIAES